MFLPVRVKIALLVTLIGLVVAVPVFAQQPRDDSGAESLPRMVDVRKVTAEERSNLPPLMERYLLDEIKSLRTDMQGMRTDLMREVVNRQLEAIDKAISYSSNTVTYFFYFVAAVGALLTMLGWQSLRELKSSVRSLAHTELRRLSDEFETRLSALEEELRLKSQVINENQRQIERTQSLHAYWLQANQVTNPRSKIEIYDRMLEMAPGDPEVMAYKADAALMLGERDWALSLCNRLLAEAPESANGHYQRACANAGLGFREAALADLHRAVELSDAMRQPAWSEVEFESLREMPEFAEILGPRSETEGSRPAE